MKRTLLNAALAAIIATGTLTGPAADPQLKYSTPMPPGVAMPDSVETRLGTLKFFDGFPDQATAKKLYDNLDFQRAVQAYLLATPATAIASYCDAVRSLGPENTVVPIWEDLLDARLILLTGNNNTVYSIPCIDLSQGPIVFELPPKVLGFVNSTWEQWVTDIGFTGPDKGEGGKYLFLPPDYDAVVPDGFHVVRSSTFNLWFLWRSFSVNGDTGPGIELVKTFTKIYPLGGSPTAPTFVNMSSKPYNTVSPTNYQFWERLNEVVQAEPSASLDPIRLGYYASIGIQKGKPFAPDDRMKKILTEAAAVGAGTARTLAFHNRQKEAYYYPDSNWQLPWIGGYEFQTEPDVMNLDAYISYSFLGIGISPAMEVKRVGKGSQYAWTARDASGNPLDGGKSYRLRLPPNIPAKDFWSVIIYSDQTRSLLQTDQRFPSVSSQAEGLLGNANGSVDIYIGPKAPQGKEKNWVQTVPGKGWFVVLRLYAPLESWFDKTWRPGEIELQP